MYANVVSDVDALSEGRDAQALALDLVDSNGQVLSTPTASSHITIVLADDHQVVRSRLRMLLEAEERFAVVAEAGDVGGAEEVVLSFRPQVLVLDLNMGGESSLGSIPRLRRLAPETQIVVLTMQDDPAFAREALRCGALAYVLKDAADADLVNAVRLAAQGRRYLNPELCSKLGAEPPLDDDRPDALSPREIEVLRLVAFGQSNGEIAESLFLSLRTVESHRAQIQRKVHLTTPADLVAYLREHGLLD